MNDVNNQDEHLYNTRSKSNNGKNKNKRKRSLDELNTNDRSKFLKTTPDFDNISPSSESNSDSDTDSESDSEHYLENRPDEDEEDLDDVDENGNIKDLIDYEYHDHDLDDPNFYKNLMQDDEIFNKRTDNDKNGLNGLNGLNGFDKNKEDSNKPKSITPKKKNKRFKISENDDHFLEFTIMDSPQGLLDEINKQNEASAQTLLFLQNGGLIRHTSDSDSEYVPESAKSASTNESSEAADDEATFLKNTIKLFDSKFTELAEKAKKKPMSIDRSIRQRIDQSKMSAKLKEECITKLETCELDKKQTEWFENLLKVPFGEYKSFEHQNKSKAKACEPYVVLENLMNVMDKQVYGLVQVKEEIINYASQCVTNKHAIPRALGLTSKPGVGKCLAKGTEIWMANGTLKKVENIKNGDKLLGDNNDYRNVSGTTTGKSIMYKIKLLFDDKHLYDYTVNEHHILTFKLVSAMILKKSQIENVQTILIYRFKEKDYLSVDCLMNDEEVKLVCADKSSFLTHTNRVLKQASQIGEVTQYRYQDERWHIQDYRYKQGDFTQDSKSDADDLIKTEIVDMSIQQYISMPKTLQELYFPVFAPNLNHWNAVPTKIDPFQRGRNAGDKLSPKFQDKIEEEYICNSLENRTEFLSGFLFQAWDISTRTDDFGQTSTVYVVEQTNTNTLNTVCSMFESVGQIAKIYNNPDNSNVELHLSSLSSLTKLQLQGLIEMKVEQLPVDDYYGFELDGNGRFILRNLIVTHNTSIAKCIGSGFNRPFQSINLNGFKDSSSFLGHDYTYVGSKNGLIIEAIINAKCMNPVLFFDELDKISDSVEGREIENLLMAITDPVTNSEFTDKYFASIKFDLSKCLLVFAFNDVENISPVLRDRLQIIHIPTPTNADKINIAKDYLIPQLSSNIGCDIKDLCKLSDKTLQHIIKAYCVEGEGVRQLKRHIETILMKINTLKLLEKSKLKMSYDLKQTFPIDLNEEMIDILLKSDKTEGSTNHYSMYA